MEFADAGSRAQSPVWVDYLLKKSGFCAAGLTTAMAARLLGHRRCGHRDQLGQLPEVLGGGGEEELVAGAAGAA